MRTSVYARISHWKRFLQDTCKIHVHVTEISGRCFTYSVLLRWKLKFIIRDLYCKINLISCSWIFTLVNVDDVLNISSEYLGRQIHDHEIRHIPENFHSVERCLNINEMALLFQSGAVKIWSQIPHAQEVSECEEVLSIFFNEIFPIFSWTRRCFLETDVIRDVRRSSKGIRWSKILVGICMNTQTACKVQLRSKCS